MATTQASGKRQRSPVTEDPEERPNKQTKLGLEVVPQASPLLAPVPAADLSFPVVSGTGLTLPVSLGNRSPGRNSRELRSPATPTFSEASVASLNAWAHKSPLSSPTCSLACSLQHWARSIDAQDARSSGALEQVEVPPPTLPQQQQQPVGDADEADEEYEDTATSSSSEGDSLSSSRSSSQRPRAAGQQQHSTSSSGASLAEDEADNDSIKSDLRNADARAAFTFVSPQRAPSTSEAVAPASAAAAAAAAPTPFAATEAQVAQQADADGGAEPWLFCGQQWSALAVQVSS